MEFKKNCGNTPLIKVADKLYAKLETYNPTGSVKDRMISYVVDKAIKSNLSVMELFGTSAAHAQLLVELFSANPDFN